MSLPSAVGGAGSRRTLKEGSSAKRVNLDDVEKNGSGKTGEKKGRGTRGDSPFGWKGGAVPGSVRIYEGTMHGVQESKTLEKQKKGRRDRKGDAKEKSWKIIQSRSP